MDNLFFVLAAIIIDAVIIREMCWLDYLNDFAEAGEMKTSIKIYFYFLALIVLCMVGFVPYKMIEIFNFQFTYIVISLSTIGMAIFSFKYSKFCTNTFIYLREKENFLVNTVVSIEEAQRESSSAKEVE